jgi:hypothetical protein
MGANTHLSREVRRRRGGLVFFAALFTLVAAACSPSGGGGLSIPLPPISLGGSTISIPLGGGVCSANVTLPSAPLTGITISVPGLQLGLGTITVPVTVNVPASTLTLPSVGVGCLGLNLSTPIIVHIPKLTIKENATVNLATGQLQLASSTLNLTGLSVTIVDLGGLTIPLGTSITIPPISIPLG